MSTQASVLTQRDSRIIEAVFTEWACSAAETARVTSIPRKTSTRSTHPRTFEDGPLAAVAAGVAVAACLGMMAPNPLAGLGMGIPVAAALVTILVRYGRGAEGSHGGFSASSGIHRRP